MDGREQMDGKRKERKHFYKKKKIRKPRPGRVECLKEVVHLKDGEVNQLSLHAMAMKKVATKVVASNRCLKRYVIN